MSQAASTVLPKAVVAESIARLYLRNGVAQGLLTFPVPGITEMVEHMREGVIVPERDPSALADAIGGLLDDERLWRAMSAAGPHMTPALQRPMARSSAVASAYSTMRA